MNPSIPTLNIDNLRNSRNELVKEVISLAESEAIQHIAEHSLIPELFSEQLTSLEMTEEETGIAKGLIENHFTEQSPQIITRDFLLLLSYLPAHIIPINVFLEYIPDNLILHVLEKLLEQVPAFDTQEDMEQKAYLLKLSYNYIARRIKIDPYSEITDKCADLLLKSGSSYPCLNIAGDPLQELSADTATIFNFILNKYQLTGSHTSTGENSKIGIFTSHVGNDDSTLYALQLLEDFKEKGIETLFICDSGASMPIQKKIESLATETIALAKGIKDAILQIQQLNLDLLIFTDPLYDPKHPTFLLALQKLAKTQIALQNTKITTGSQAIDYIFIDKNLNNCENQFTENLVSIDQLNYSLARPVDQEEEIESPTRKEINVDEETTLYVSAAPMHSITPQVRETWISILKNKENSKLLLLPYQSDIDSEISYQQFASYLEMEADAQGVSRSDLLILSDPISLSQILDSYISLADVYLDVFPNNSSYTAGRALKLNIPVVTLQGETLREKSTSAMLSRPGVNIEPAQNIEEYKSQACNPDKIQKLNITESDFHTSVADAISSLQS